MHRIVWAENVTVTWYARFSSIDWQNQKPVMHLSPGARSVSGVKVDISPQPCSRASII